MLSFVGSTGSTTISFILPGLFWWKVSTHPIMPFVFRLLMPRLHSFHEMIPPRTKLCREHHWDWLYTESSSSCFGKPRIVFLQDIRLTLVMCGARSLSFNIYGLFHPSDPVH